MQWLKGKDSWREEGTIVADVQLLRQILDTIPAIEQDRLCLGTWWASPRTAGLGPVGCLVGHWISRLPAKAASPFSLKPIHFLEQTKSAIVRAAVLEQYPADKWQHYIPAYRSGTLEAYGETAVMIGLMLRPWDLNRLFYPAGADYVLQPALASLAFRLRSFINTVPHAPPPGSLPRPALPADR